jgi:hypothetical protein
MLIHVNAGQRNGSGSSHTAAMAGLNQQQCAAQQEAAHS